MATLKVNPEFIEKLKKDDDKTVEQLRDYCYNYLMKITQSDHFLSDDITQEAVFNILNSLKRGSFSSNKESGSLGNRFRSFVRKTCYNRYSNYRDNKKRELSVDDLLKAYDLKDDAIDKEAKLDALFYHVSNEIKANETNPLLRLARNDVFKTLRSLNNSKKIYAVYLKLFLGYDIKATAKTLGISEADANITIFRAKKALKKLFKQKGIDANYFDEFKFEQLFSSHLSKSKRKKKKKGR